MYKYHHDAVTPTINHAGFCSLLNSQHASESKEGKEVEEG